LEGEVEDKGQTNEEDPMEAGVVRHGGGDVVLLVL
jgi:hypothetical protein